MRNRKILSELCGLCNELGGDLDGTATHESKYKDRQRAHMLVYKVLYGVLVDSPDNDQRDHDMEEANEALKKLKEVAAKNYPDRNGLHSFTDPSQG